MFGQRISDIAINIIWFLILYLAPTFDTILIIGFFVFCDMITGIMAAKKQGIELTSKKLRPTVGKFISYGIAILVAHVIEQHFIHDFPSLKVMAGLIAYIELKSMNENIEKITGYNLFKTVLNKFKL